MIVDRVALARAALEGGAPVIQVRTKGVTDRAAGELAAEVAELCAAHGALCVVNDRVDLALAAGAGGVHLGADDLPVAAARRIAPPEMLLGGTARNPETATRLAADGASYLGVGPVYGTTSKDGLPAPIGLDGLRAVATAADAAGVPVIAIAGITAERVPEVLAAGAHGVAVIGAVAAADDPRRATEALVAAIATSVGEMPLHGRKSTHRTEGGGS
ncbi:MAG TPA: thiamine phosphate synthase [Acidimicrobiales bacterium]